MNQLISRTFLSHIGRAPYFHELYYSNVASFLSVHKKKTRFALFYTVKKQISKTKPHLHTPNLSGKLITNHYILDTNSC